VDQPSSGGQCRCSWHGGSRCQQDVAVTPPPSSNRRHPTFIFTVEFASDSADEDIITSADNEEPPQESHRSSTEQPDTGQAFLGHPYSKYRLCPVTPEHAEHPTLPGTHERSSHFLHTCCTQLSVLCVRYEDRVLLLQISCMFLRMKFDSATWISAFD